MTCAEFHHSLEHKTVAFRLTLAIRQTIQYEDRESDPIYANSWTESSSGDCTIIIAPDKVPYTCTASR